MTPKSQFFRKRRRIPIRTKITLPYIILAIVLALSVGYVIARIVVDSIEERFTNNLIEAGQLTAEWMVSIT
jgi:adenylate cyclase